MLHYSRLRFLCNFKETNKHQEWIRCWTAYFCSYTSQQWTNSWNSISFFVFSFLERTSVKYFGINAHSSNLIRLSRYCSSGVNWRHVVWKLVQSGDVNIWNTYLRNYAYMLRVPFSRNTTTSYTRFCFCCFWFTHIGHSKYLWYQISANADIK